MVGTMSPEFRGSLTTESVALDHVTTLPELPGFVIVAVHGIAADTATAAGKAARTKAVDSFQEAMHGVRRSAASKGANAIVGLQVANFGASAGGAFGDAVGTTLMGTAVTVQPVD
jgi:uncharacterized protein YbjQ (UPF0145 family)